MKIKNTVIVKRVYAFLLDYFIVLIPASIFVTVTYTVMSLDFSAENVMLSLLSATFTFLMPWNFLIGMIFGGTIHIIMINVISFSFVYSLYCLLMELTTGKTIGAKTEKLECVNDDLQRPNKKAILLRNFWKFISFACLFLGLIPALFGERKTLYDILSKTEVREI